MVLDLGFLGDTVHLVPALWMVRQAYPQAELHAVVADVVAPAIGRAAAIHDRANTRPAQMGDSCGVAGLADYFADSYRGGKPHHMAAAGHNCIGWAAGGRTAGGTGCLLPRCCFAL